MATKAQKKTQKARRREKKRQREKQQTKKLRQTSPAKRLSMRLRKQIPQAWAEESQEDVAIFDDQVLLKLAQESQEHAKLIRTALDEVCRRSGEQALEATSVISRRSPFSEWRLFLRGLVDWLNESPSSAKEAWARLDKQRRPSRIARSLELSSREDLSTLEIPPPTAESNQTLEGNRLTDVDQDIIHNAQLVRKFQVDRVALRAAKRITQIPIEVEDATVCPTHIAWLRDFSAEYRELEPDLVHSLELATIRRSFCGPYVDIFRDAIRYFQGPKHDPKSNLLHYFFEHFGGQHESSQRYLNQYLDHDLPNNTELAPALRDAIRSQIHLVLAAQELTSDDRDGDGLFSIFSRGPDMELVESHFRAAVKAYPKNRAAWTGLQSIFLDAQNNERLKKAELSQLQKRLAEIQQEWIKELPDDIEPRLALVDFLLEDDRSDEAKEHVEWLAGTHRNDPLADAMTWRFNLLEAMRLCRRKAWTSQAPERLDQAEQNWPRWLSDEWLQFLRAAVGHRAGNVAAFDALEHPTSDGVSTKIDLISACMKLAAAQRMRVPAADLKPLRKPIEEALSNLQQFSTEQLLQLASFYWDLHRTRLKYPAYRMHGTKFLAELLGRFRNQPKLVNQNLDSPLIRDALLIMSNEGMFNDAYAVKLPGWLDSMQMNHPVLVAVAATAALRRRVDWGIVEHANLVEKLKKASEKADVFYRHHFNQIADELDARIRKDNRTGTGSFFDRFADFDEDEDDRECNCEECRAARGELVE